MTRLLALLLSLSILGTAETAASRFQLHISQGYRFDTGEVTKSGDDADLSFTYQLRRIGQISFLQAPHIKRFETRPQPGTLTPAEIATWDHSVAAPSPGYYVIQGRSPAHHYLLHLEKFENQGKAASRWELTFSWETLK